MNKIKSKRRIHDRRNELSLLEGTDRQTTGNRRLRERRRRRRGSIYIRCVRLKNDFKFFLFILIICILIAITYVFNDAIFFKQGDKEYLLVSLEATQQKLKIEKNLNKVLKKSLNDTKRRRE